MRPRFLLWSAIIPDKWKLKFVPSGTSAMDFAHYQSSTFVFLAHLPIPTKFNIGRIWDRLLAIIQYISRIWDGRQNVKSLIVWDFPDICKPGLTCSPPSEFRALLSERLELGFRPSYIIWAQATWSFEVNWHGIFGGSFYGVLVLFIHIF